MSQNDQSRVKCYCLLNLNAQPISQLGNYPGTKKSFVSLVAQNAIFHSDFLNQSDILYQTLIAYQQKSQQQALVPFQKIYCESGVWYCKIKSQFAIGLLVTPDYPISSAMRLLGKIDDLIKSKLQPLNTRDIELLEPNIRQFLNLYDKDPYTDDVLEVTAKSVDSIQGQMEDNIRKIQVNQQALEIVHHKSAEVAQVAGQFAKGAKDLKTKVQWQQYAIIGLISLAVGGTVLYFMIKIF